MAVSKLERVRQEEAQAKADLRRRPDFETRIDAIDERLDHDPRIRTRITRLKPPDSIVTTIGDRPAPSPASTHQFDVAAGLLARHQAAFDFTDGLGRLPRTLERNAYIESWAYVAERLEFLSVPAVIEREVSSIGLDF